VAEPKPASVTDNKQAPALINVLRTGLHFLLGDQHDPAPSKQCDNRDVLWSHPSPERTALIYIRMLVSKPARFA
jgi:hypothetical protein